VKTRTSALLVVVAIAVATVYRLPSDIDNLVGNGIAFYGSVMTKALVSAATVEFTDDTGKGTIRNFKIGNPVGFKSAHAFKVDRIDVDIDMESLNQDVVVIRMILVNGPDVIYEKGDQITNVDAIRKNIAVYLDNPITGSDGLGQKLVVEELTICNSRAKASAAFMDGRSISVPLYDMTLKNLGKTEGGFTPAELGQAIAAAIDAKLSKTVSFDQLQDSTKQYGVAGKNQFN
jgi:hypothetical protein